MERKEKGTERKKEKGDGVEGNKEKEKASGEINPIIVFFNDVTVRQNDKIGQQFGIIHDFDPVHDYRSQNSQGPLRLLANFVIDNHGRGGATTIFARGPPCEYCDR